MNKKTTTVLGLSGLAALSVNAQEVAPSFDVSAFSGILETGIGTATTIAISMASIAAGVLAWKKIAKYFSKAG